MNYLQALLVAEAREAGRGQRSATLRHRHLTKKPMGMLAWQLGAEPFTAASVAWGFGPKRFEIAVPGEPRDRELAFRALARVARAFNPWFEGGHGGHGPQVILPNRGNLALLGRLARRLAYLPTDGERAADPVLVRFGWHLRFLTDHAHMPGQSLLLCATDLIASHWITELSELEMQSLVAADAAVDPPEGMTAHEAVLAAETLEIGPAPSSAVDNRTGELLERFNEDRQRRTEEALVAELRGPLEEHYREHTSPGWKLLWRCIARERALPEAPSCANRWKLDLEALGRHVDWMNKAGRYRTRQTFAQAARTLRSWEDAQRRLVADEAIDDPLRMAPFFLTDEAIAGRVVAVDTEHKIPGAKRAVCRPLVTVVTRQPTSVTPGQDLYWTDHPNSPYTVVEVEPDPNGGGSRVVLEYQTSRREYLVDEGAEVILSVHARGDDYFLRLPRERPWTHAAPEPPPSIESPAGEEAWE